MDLGEQVNTVKGSHAQVYLLLQNQTLHQTQLYINSQRIVHARAPSNELNL